MKGFIGVLVDVPSAWAMFCGPRLTRMGRWTLSILLPYAEELACVTILFLSLLGLLMHE